MLRLGLGAESLAWALIFLIQPLSGVYYPVTTLPAWLQPVAWCLPSAPIFEGMRAVLFTQHLPHRPPAARDPPQPRLDGARVVVFLLLFRSARNRGLLLQVGE